MKEIIMKLNIPKYVSEIDIIGKPITNRISPNEITINIGTITEIVKREDDFVTIKGKIMDEYYESMIAILTIQELMSVGVGTHYIEKK